MNPLFLLSLVTTGIVGTIALGFYLGHVFATKLSKTAPQSWVGRRLRDYRVWGVLGGLLACACVLGSAIHLLVVVVVLPLMCFAIVVADHFEPAVKACGSCGRS